VSISSVFFFFQAEDGIRDTSVTGVQTCALPICQLFTPRHPATRASLAAAVAAEQALPIDDMVASAVGAAAVEQFQYPVLEYAVRSEERRVGKECRSRRSR